MWLVTGSWARQARCRDPRATGRAHLVLPHPWRALATHKSLWPPIVSCCDANPFSMSRPSVPLLGSWRAAHRKSPCLAALMTRGGAMQPSDESTEAGAGIVEPPARPRRQRGRPPRSSYSTGGGGVVLEHDHG